MKHNSLYGIKPNYWFYLFKSFHPFSNTHSFKPSNLSIARKISKLISWFVYYVFSICQKYINPVIDVQPCIPSCRKCLVGFLLWITFSSSDRFSFLLWEVKQKQFDEARSIYNLYLLRSYVRPDCVFWYITCPTYNFDEYILLHWWDYTTKSTSLFIVGYNNFYSINQGLFQQSFTIFHKKRSKCMCFTSDMCDRRGCFPLPVSLLLLLVGKKGFIDSTAPENQKNEMQ